MDVRAPSDAWMRRVDSDSVEIGCYMSRQVWVLRCVDNQFVGVIGNCTQRQSIHLLASLHAYTLLPFTDSISSIIVVKQHATCLF